MCCSWDVLSRKPLLYFVNYFFNTTPSSSRDKSAHGDSKIYLIQSTRVNNTALLFSSTNDMSTKSNAFDNIQNITLLSQ